MLNLTKFPPSTIASVIYPWWQFADHLKTIEAIIINLYQDDDFNNLILQLPLRFGKTQYVCQLLTFCLLLHNPDENILLASYSSQFSSESVARVRDLIYAYGKELNNIEIDPSWSGKDYFKLKGRKGSLRGVSVGSKFGGADANTIICDDIYSDPSEAASPAIRKSIESWFHGQLMGRKTPSQAHPPKTILIGTPKHPEDLSQQLEAANPDLPESEKWVIHRLPAISPEGIPLWPDRFPKDKLEKIKAQFDSLGQSHYYDTLYLCDPKLSPEGGWPHEYLQGLFYDKLPDILNPIKIMAADTNTGSQSGRGDYGCVLGATYDPYTGHIWIEQVYLSQDPYDRLENAAVKMLLEYKPRGFLIETNAAGRVIADNIDLKARQAGIQFPPIFHRYSKEKKEERIDIVLSPLLNQKKIHLCDCKGSRLGLMQMKSFPTGKNDDFVDTIWLLTQMIAKLQEQGHK